MPTFKVGVRGLAFDAASFTMGENPKCSNLHGHTYTVDVEVEGEIDERTGMVLDFSTLKRLVRQVISEYDHVVLVPRRYSGSVELKGPFGTEVKYVDKPHATAEYLALEIAERLFSALKMRVRVTVHEGSDKYAAVELP